MTGSNNNITEKFVSKFLNQMGDSSTDIKITVVTNDSDLSKLQNDWDELAECSGATIFQTYEWSSLWWKHYGNVPNNELLILLFHHNSKLVGIAPFVLQINSILGLKFWRRICLLGSGDSFGKSFGIFLDNGPSDYLDVIVKPGYEISVANSVVSYLKNRKQDYDEIQLLNVREGGFIYSNLLPALRQLHFDIKITKADQCPYLSTPQSMAEYFIERPSSIRRRLTQSLKAADDGSLFTIKTNETISDIQTSLSDIIKLHQERWNRIGYPGLFSDSRFKNLQTDVIKAFHSKGWIWCKTAHSENQCIAGRIAFKFDSRYFDYLSGFDDLSPAAKRRPGVALLLTMIQDAINQQVSTIDLLRGDEQYKYELTSDFLNNWNIRLFPRSATNAVKAPKQFCQVLQFIGYLFSRELNLLKIQIRQHNSLIGVLRYFKFRFPLLTQKAKKLKKNEQTN